VFHGGAALKYIRNNWLVAGSVSGSFARYDTSRYDIPTAGTATANADTDTLDLRLRLAYAFGTPAFYVKPMVDFDAVGLWRGAIDESGAGALNLHVQSGNDWVASAAPAVEFGTQWRRGGYTWRPYVRAGVRFLSEDDFSATASFEGSPAGIAPFTVTSPLDQTLAEVSAGFDVWKDKRYSLRLGYDGRFGGHTSDNAGSLEVHAAF
jgi:outer membrane autotransporter protein